MLSVEVVNALEFKGIHVIGKVILGDEKNEFKLNGVAMRTKFFFDIYVSRWLDDEAADDDLKAAMLNTDN